MNIRFFISFSLFLFSISFSAFATDYFHIIRVDSKLCGGWGVGSVITSDLFSSACIGSLDPSGNKIIRAATCSGTRCSACWPKYSEGNSRNQCQTVYTVQGADAICPDGEEYNPETGLCEGPPEEAFCSQESTQQEMAAFQSQCMADGGTSSIVCNDNVSPPDFRMSCEVLPPIPDPDECTTDSDDWPACKDDEPEPDPDQCDSSSPDWVDSVGKCCNESNNWCDEPVTDDSCTIFSPNWETCKGDLDIDPPSGDDLQDPDKPTGGGTGTNPDNPDNPDSDNSNLASAIGAVKESVDLNTTTIVESSNHIKDAIDRQGEALTESGNINNQLLGSLNNLVNDGFGDLNGQLEGIGNSIDGLGKGIDDLADDLNGAVSENGCTSFSCEGNAATCYLARKAWEEGCQNTDITQLAEAGDSLISGLSEFNDKFRDGDGNFKGGYNDENIESLIKSYDKSNGLSFDGECPQPKRYEAGLFNFTIDLSPFCEMALIIRACLMAAAAFASYMMIAKYL